MKTAQRCVQTSLGRLYLVASEKGLRGIYWKKQSVPDAVSLAENAAEVRILSRSVDQLKDYLAGRLKKFNLPLDLDGTLFQKKVWGALMRIPYGQTRSYRDIARLIQNPRAVRAVGSANGQNPLCIVVPCHRVISSDGSLGGYSGGLRKKRHLLRIEEVKRF